MISVVIPVKDGGLDLVRCLEAIKRQRIDQDVEIVVIDSGSTDGSAQRARSLGARVEEIKPEEFSHGGSRNRGARLAQGETLVFTTQDAYADDDMWLARLVEPLSQDPALAGVYGRQIAHREAIPSEQYFLDFLYGTTSRTQRIRDPDRFTFKATLFSNVNSAMPRAVWEAFPFAEDLVMSEDQEWSRRVLLAGYSIAYEARAVVRHSHAYSLPAAFRRFFDSGASASRAYVGRDPESRVALRESGMRYARGELAWLWKTRQRRWIPYAALYETAKFAGLQLGLRHQRLPASLKRRLSGIPGHWDSKGVTRESRDGALRVCLVYDHLFPQTVGGAERLMRDLALHLSESGCQVTYLTMRHWAEHDVPALPGVDVIGLTEPGQVYLSERRALLPPVRFGLAVARYLWRHGNEFDIVHMASFPYFPLLAAGLLRRRAGYDIVVTWLEIWTRAYWCRYAGLAIGMTGWVVQSLCVRTRHTALCLSRMHARRLVASGFPGSPSVLPGLYAGPVSPTPADDVDPALVVYAGRHVVEKRVSALIRAFAFAREAIPDLRLRLYGDGPERPSLERLAAELGLASHVEFRGRQPEAEVADAVAHAACVATASEREGYGLVVVEAAARGTPSVVVAGPENAATELVIEGVNGAIAPDASPAAFGTAIARVVGAGTALRTATTDWFSEHAETLRIDRSFDLVARAYEETRGLRHPTRRLKSRVGE